MLPASPDGFSLASASLLFHSLLLSLFSAVLGTAARRPSTARPVSAWLFSASTTVLGRRGLIMLAGTFWLSSGGSPRILVASPGATAFGCAVSRPSAGPRACGGGLYFGAWFFVCGSASLPFVWRGFAPPGGLGFTLWCLRVFFLLVWAPSVAVVLRLALAKLTRLCAGFCFLAWLPAVASRARSLFAVRPHLPWLFCRSLRCGYLRLSRASASIFPWRAPAFPSRPSVPFLPALRPWFCHRPRSVGRLGSALCFLAAVCCLFVSLAPLAPPFALAMGIPPAAGRLRPRSGSPLVWLPLLRLGSPGLPSGFCLVACFFSILGRRSCPPPVFGGYLPAVARAFLLVLLQFAFSVCGVTLFRALCCFSRIFAFLLLGFLGAPRIVLSLSCWLFAPPGFWLLGATLPVVPRLVLVAAGAFHHAPVFRVFSFSLAPSRRLLALAVGLCLCRLAIASPPVRLR